jgi:hypothetical protein
MKFFAAAPGALWVAIIIGLTAGATWLSQFYGGLEWVPPVAGFVMIVLVPVLKILAQGDVPSIESARGGVTKPRSLFSRWLL